jgi:hypothetical protein
LRPTISTGTSHLERQREASRLGSLWRGFVVRVWPLTYSTRTYTSLWLVSQQHILLPLRCLLLLLSSFGLFLRHTDDFSPLQHSLDMQFVNVRAQLLYCSLPLYHLPTMTTLPSASSQLLSESDWPIQELFFHMSACGMSMRFLA